MLEEALSDMVKLHLTKTLQRMQIAPLIKPHEVATALEVIDTLDVMQTLELIAHVDLSAAPITPVDPPPFWLVKSLMRQEID